jgi:2-keto-4-pentenoate hydratase/2-oxohepta-3-ene-1,7-dioic acid hydratase in catechol pathway
VHARTGRHHRHRTPAGIGITRKPPILLKPGDTVRIEIDNIGTIENPVIADSD